MRSQAARWGGSGPMRRLYRNDPFNDANSWFYTVLSHNAAPYPQGTRYSPARCRRTVSSTRSIRTETRCCDPVTLVALPPTRLCLDFALELQGPLAVGPKADARGIGIDAGAGFRLFGF